MGHLPSIDLACLPSQSKNRTLTKSVVTRPSTARGVMQRLGRMIVMLMFPLVDVYIWYHCCIGHSLMMLSVVELKKFLRWRPRSVSSVWVPCEQTPDKVVDGLTEHLRTWADSDVPPV